MFLSCFSNNKLWSYLADIQVEWSSAFRHCRYLHSSYGRVGLRRQIKVLVRKGVGSNPTVNKYYPVIGNRSLQFLFFLNSECHNDAIGAQALSRGVFHFGIVFFRAWFVTIAQQELRRYPGVIFTSVFCFTGRAWFVTIAQQELWRSQRIFSHWYCGRGG